MSPLQAVLLGVLQGVTEFIPVSSSGHLVLVPMALGWEAGGLAFNATVHLGTLLSLLVYFRAELLRILSTALAGRGDDPRAKRRLLSYLAIATIPAALAGFFFESTVEPLFQSGRSVGFALLATAVVLTVGELMARRSSRQVSHQQLGLPRALAIGVAQACAILPGLSRSGATVVAGLAVGLDRAASARFSLLLAIPIVAGAGLFALANTISNGVGSEEILPLALGGVSAAAAGYLAIGWLVSWSPQAPIVPFCRLLCGGRCHGDCQLSCLNGSSA